ncbi:hypothetical protein [uncultured Clostridium sp.]|uniref:hypothetical protein n=1 Tax=uncultured Clostridium sp. TaxID=59620 RepID=UPI0027300FEA|nr:hypothetical protein [uncultured Clostridium sp.]
MITDRDREIINFIYKIGFITIEQAGKIFYTDSKVSYDLARRRLKKISITSDYIKRFTNPETRQIIYIPKNSKLKKLSKHSILIIDYLAALKLLGADIEKVEIEKDFGGVIPDALISFNFNGYRYYQLLEVELRHDYVNCNRFNKIITNILEETNNVLPTIIIIQNTNKDYLKDNKTDMEIVQLKTSLEDIAKVLI